MKPTGEPRAADFDRIATTLWNAKGDDKNATSVKPSIYECIGDEPNVKNPGPKFKFMHAYKYLETSAKQNLTLSAVESASPDKPASTVAVIAASPLATTVASTTPTGFLRMKSSAELHVSVDLAVQAPEQWWSMATQETWRPYPSLLCRGRATTFTGQWGRRER
jgi:hypothetical protein